MRWGGCGGSCPRSLATILNQIIDNDDYPTRTRATRLDLEPAGTATGAVRTHRGVMTRPASRKRRQRELAGRLRAEGKTWVEIAEFIREEFDVNARVAMRLAHGWSQHQAAAEWNKRWFDDLKAGKNFSHWETWPESGHAPSLKVLDRLARLYECGIVDLLADISDYRHCDKAVRRPRQQGGLPATSSATPND